MIFQVDEPSQLIITNPSFNMTKMKSFIGMNPDWNELHPGTEKNMVMGPYPKTRLAVDMDEPWITINSCL